MANKIIYVIIEMFYPQSNLQLFLKECSQLKFESKLTPRLQNKDQMFYPYHYKDPFVRDCILELKERNSHKTACLFGNILNKWIVKKIVELKNKNVNNFFIVPIPQHISKTKDKGFCHTTTLSKNICLIIDRKYPKLNISFFPCIKKTRKTKKLHNSQNKRMRFNIIKNTFLSFITKQDSKNSYFFIIDDVYTTGATFKEARRSLSDSGVPNENMFFISIAH